ncbi:MAG: hypothetical protein Kow00121_56000 [Elainellaceae cyanobacterium]
MMTYLMGATCTCGILLSAFLSDHTTLKTDMRSWIVLLIGTSLWFLVLPSIIGKRLFDTMVGCRV